MGVYKDLVCYDCKKIYQSYKCHELLDEELKNHEGHTTDFAYDGEICGEYIDNNGEFHGIVWEPDNFEEIDLTV